MEKNYEQTFPVYKGLQRPLIFKGFKGKYIYWGFVAAVGSLLISVITSTIFTFVVGGICLISSLFGGIAILAFCQKRFGLYNKKTENKILIVKTIFQS